MKAISLVGGLRVMQTLENPLCTEDGRQSRIQFGVSTRFDGVLHGRSCRGLRDETQFGHLKQSRLERHDYCSYVSDLVCKTNNASAINIVLLHHHEP